MDILHSVVCFFCVITTVYAGLLQDFTSPRGFGLTDNLSVKLEEKNTTNSDSNSNSSFLDKHALKMEFSDYAISLFNNNEKGAVEVELSKEDKATGRSRKMGNMLLPAILGFKGTGIIAAILFMTKVIVVKALIVAKFALLVSTAIFIKKYLHHEHHEPHYIEIEHHGDDHHPVFLDHGDEGHAATNYVAYANYVPSAQAQTQVINYAVDPGNGSNLTEGTHQIVVPIAAKKADDKKIPKLPFYTVRKVIVKA